MKVSIFVIFIVGVFGDCDKSKCRSIPIHYDELGCKPVINSGDCCPKSFDCSNLESRSDDKCYYNGKTYDPDSSIDDDSLKASCIGAAHCTDGGNFIHAHRDCAEFFGPPLPSDCIRQYSRDQCCSIGNVCGNKAKELKTCEFEGKTYKIGERMYSDKNSCYTCYCTSDFDNKLSFDKNPNCVKVNCQLEILDYNKIKNKCVPVYHKDSCCPSNWRCPSTDDAVVAGNNKDTSGPKCKFGKLEFNIDDSLALGDNKCQKCTCSIPPFLSCSFVDC
ncbi:hypothetical protein PVAND_009498 [Polypedilum vanderplanki]|uniref:Uncharacterized protein n=1 Tax=Polypedilum vanderplanki TaxID=319348 RepID=A0A9J6CDW7_POLVA|nr:hypothetical protein PVAND_009498 [Polypedilum vanderplanki]